MSARSSERIIALCSTLTSLSSSRTVAALRRTWPRARSRMPAFRQRFGLTRREECVNTLHGPALGFKFWSARKRHRWRVMCSRHRFESGESSEATSKLTTTLDHRGASFYLEGPHCCADRVTTLPLNSLYRHGVSYWPAFFLADSNSSPACHWIRAGCDAACRPRS